MSNIPHRIPFSPNDPIEQIVRSIREHRYSAIDAHYAKNHIIESGYRCSVDELDADFAWSLAGRGYFFTFDELRQLGNSKTKKSRNYTIAHEMASWGFMFTVDQLLELGDEPCDYDLDMHNTISLYMAKRGYQFTFEDIQRLNNPVDGCGVTLAHLSICESVWTQSGHIFFNDYEHFDCNQKLPVSIPAYPQNTSRHFQHPHFTVEQLLEMGNPADKDGDTVAHMMAEAGHRFTHDDLRRLGDSRNFFGETVADIMSKKRSGYEYIDAKLWESTYTHNRNCIIYDLYVNGRITLFYQFALEADEYFKVYNREAFEIFLNNMNCSNLSSFLYEEGIEKLKFVEKLKSG